MKKLTVKCENNWWLKRSLDGGRYITNFCKELAPIYIQAIELGQFDFLEVREYPNPEAPAFRSGTNPEAVEYFSLFSNRHTDLTDFWKVFRILETLVK